MRKSTVRGRLLLVLLVSLFLAVLCPLLFEFSPPSGAQPENDSQRRVIVSWRADSHPAEREVASISAGGRLIHHYKSGHGALVWLPNAAAEERLRRDPRVTQVAPNRRIQELSRLEICGPPYCEDCGGGGGGTPPGTQRVPLGVSRIGAAPGVVSYNGTGVGVAVVDSGINRQHRDLIRPDGTRVVSPTCYVANELSTCDSDLSILTNGHGTKVAGIIAAVNNDVDLVGVAPGATLYNVNVFKSQLECEGDETFCATDDTLIAGLQWIIDNHNTVSPPIKVANISLGRPGTPGDNQVLFGKLVEVQNLEIVAVVAACNDPTREVIGTVPAGYGEPVMAIASTTAVNGADDGSACAVLPHVPADTASWFTTDGRFDPNTHIGVTVSAPGEDREDVVAAPGACVPRSVGLEVLARDGALARDAGTSLSSAHVAGVVALMKQKAAALGAQLFIQVARQKIQDTASRRGEVPLDSTHTDYTFDSEREGIVWAPAALQALH